MIKNIVGGLIMVLFVIGGAIAADALKPGEKRFMPSSQPDGTAAGYESEAVANAQASHGEAETDYGSEKQKAGTEKDHGDGHGGGHGSGHGEKANTGNVSYYKFSRQFIVPVVNSNNVQSLVMLDLNLEMEPGMIENAYSLEPKLRDAIMTELIALSNEGRFAKNMTDPQNYAAIRGELLESVQIILPDGVTDVLILDLARQDQ